MNEPNAFKNYLIENRLSVADFARKAKISEQAVYKYASGERKPRESNLEKIVRASRGKLGWQTFYPNFNSG